MDGGEKAPGAAGGGPTSTGVLIPLPSPGIETFKVLLLLLKSYKNWYKILPVDDELPGINPRYNNLLNKLFSQYFWNSKFVMVSG